MDRALDQLFLNAMAVEVPSQGSGGASSILVILAVLIALFGGVAAWVARHPDRILSFVSVVQTSPRMVRLLARYRSEIDFLARRFKAEGAFGLSFTIGLTVLVASSWLFGDVLEDVLLKQEVALLDLPVLSYFSQHRLPWLTETMKWLTAFGNGWFIFGLVVTTGLLFRRITKRWTPLTFLASTAIGGAILDLTIKAIIARPRPPSEWQAVAASGFAFPSGHTTASAIFGALALVSARLVVGWRQKVVICAAAVTSGISSSEVGPESCLLPAPFFLLKPPMQVCFEVSV